MRIACIQLNAGANWKTNWQQTEKLLLKAVKARARFILLPENFIARAAEEKMDLIIEEALPVIFASLKNFSKKYRVIIAAGSVPEPLAEVRKKDPKSANTCFVFSTEGKIIFQYRKMHLFDIQLPEFQLKESKLIQAGKEAGFFKANGISFGVGICYDLRFPEYFRILSGKGAEVLLIPANFTAKTGKTAWEVLLRARAIENQCYVLAAGQCGRHPGSGVMSYGHSMVVDPLGTVLQQASFSKPEVLIADLNLTSLKAWRKQLPALQHRKIRCF